MVCFLLIEFEYSIFVDFEIYKILFLSTFYSLLGGLLISEATHISGESVAYPFTPGNII
jgi:hypothetical protein